MEIYELGFERTDGEEEELPVAFLEQLKFVEVLSFSGSKVEMDLVKKLLEKAVVLEKMHVYWRVPPSVRCRSELLVAFLDSASEIELPTELIEEQVSDFPRCSSHAQVLFK